MHPKRNNFTCSAGIPAGQVLDGTSADNVITITGDAVNGNVNGLAGNDTIGVTGVAGVAGSNGSPGADGTAGTPAGSAGGNGGAGGVGGLGFVSGERRPSEASPPDESRAAGVSVLLLVVLGIRR
jgi:hypothetical protein